MCSEQNDVEVCQESCKLVQAFWSHDCAVKRSGLSFLGYPVH